nr:hypothetical protein B0A51_00978 [Rachicladosporium sp. CCFEE 5018]
MALTKTKAGKPAKVVKPSKNTKRSTPSTRNHRWQSFTERIATLHIDPVRRKRQPNERDGLSSGTETYTGRSLAEWRDLNLSQTFTSFATQAEPLCDSLPVLLHNEETVMGLLMEYIQRADALAMEPLLALLAHFAHDMDTRFEGHFAQAVSVVASVAAKHEDPAVVEWSFTCLAWLFKYLSRLLTPDLRPLYDLMSPYLGVQSQKPFIIRFAAESMSFLIRKSATQYERDTVPLDRIIGHVLESCPSANEGRASNLHQQGVMTLLTESMKGVQNGLHSSALSVLRCLVRCVRTKPEDSSVALLVGTLTSLIHFTQSETFQPVVDLLIEELPYNPVGHDDASVSVTSELLYTIITVRKGSRTRKWAGIMAVVTDLVTAGCERVDLSTRTRRRILRTVASVFQTGSIDAVLPALSLLFKLSEEQWAPHFLPFCEYFARLGRPRYDQLLLKIFVTHAASQAQDRPDELLALLPHLSSTSTASKIQAGPEMLNNLVKPLQELASANDDEDISKAHLSSAKLALDALTYTKLSADFVSGMSSLLQQLVERALKAHTANHSGTSLARFALGPVLQSATVIGVDISEFWLPLCQASGEGVASGAYLTSLAELLKSSVELDMTGDHVDTLCTSLVNALALPSSRLRSAALDALESVFQTRPEALNIATLIESTPLSMDTSRGLLMNIRRLATAYQDSDMDDLMRKAVPTYCFGLLHLKLSQAWTDALEALSSISKSLTGEETIVSLAQRWLDSDATQHSADAQATQVLTVDSEGFNVVSDFECSNLSKISAIAHQVFEEPHHGYPSPEQLLEAELRTVTSITQSSRGQALRVLDKIPQIAEKRSRLLVPVLLRWVSRSSDSEMQAVTADRWSRKDQKAMLGVFAKFNNPSVLFRSPEVYDALLNLCANCDVEIQKSALQALLTWKNATLSKYAEHLHNLLDDARFRDEISVFLQGGDEDGIHADDIDTIMPVLLRLLYGRAVGGSKDVQQARRKAIFVALARFDESVLAAFIGIALSGVSDSAESTESDTCGTTGASMRQQVGALNMMNDMLETLGGGMRPFAVQIADATLACAVPASKALEHDTEHAAQDSSLLKSVRQVGMQCLVKLFADMHELPLAEQGRIVVSELVTPRLDNFAAENTQSIAATLRLFAAWAGSAVHAGHLYEHNAELLTRVSDLLAHGSAQTEVKVFILREVLDKLLELPDLQQSLQPYVSGFVTSVSVILSQQPAGDLLAACVNSTVQLAERITEPAQAGQIIELCAHLLRQPGHFVHPKVKAGLVKTMMPLLDILDKAAVPTGVYEAICGLFSRLRDIESRTMFADVLVKLCQHDAALLETAGLCREINALESGRLGQPDHARKERAFDKIYDNAEIYSLDQWLPLMHNFLLFIRDEDDTVNRASAARALELFIIACAKSGRTKLIESDLFPAIQRGMKEPSELVRAEYLRLLGILVQNNPEWSEVDDMTGLTVEGDEEASFFTNVLHIQQHRRLRALRRLAEEPKLRSQNVNRIFLPLLEQFIFDQAEGDAGRTLSDQTVATIRPLAKSLKWSDYRSVIKRYLGQLKKNPEREKVVLRLIGALVDGLVSRMEDLPIVPVNADEPEASRTGRQKAILTEFLPPLSAYLHHKDESTVDRRVGVAVSIVKLLRLLPEADFVAGLAPTLTDISHILKSKDLEARDQTRRTFSTVLSLVGPTYLRFIINEMRSALQRGYQLHVLSYTVHHILVTNAEMLKPGDLDTTLTELMSVVMDDIFGVTGQEKDAEEYKSGMKEIKSSKSYDTLEIVARSTSISKMGQLILPIRAMLQERLDMKSVKKIDDLLIRIRKGIDQNPAADSRDMLAFCHEVARQVQAHEAAPHARLAEQSYNVRQYLVASEKKANRKGATTSYLFKLSSFALNLVRKVVRRHEDLQTPANMAGYLPICGDALIEGQEEVQIAAVKLLTTIIRVPLKDIEDNCAVYLKQAVAVMKSQTSSTTDAAKAALDLITAILRERRSVQVKEKDIAYLLQTLKQDLDEPDRQGILFRFLRAVLGRQIVITEVYEVMDEVAKMMITNPDESVRQSARSAYLQFVIDYPQGKDRWTKQTGFLVKNLDYQHVAGRRSVMEVLHGLLAKLGDEALQPLLVTLFVGLVTRVSGDVDAACRDMAGALIGKIFDKADEEKMEVLVGMLRKWTGADKKLSLRRAAILCWTILAKSGKATAKQTDSLLDTVAIIAADEIGNDSAAKVQLLLAGLQLLSILSDQSPAIALAAKRADLWASVQQHLNTNNVDVQLMAVQLQSTVFNDAASTTSKTQGDLSTMPLRASGGYELGQEELRTACALNFRILRDSAIGSTELIAQAVRNVAFLGRLFAANNMPWKDRSMDEDEVEADDAEDALAEKDDTAIGYLLSRLSSIIRRENAPVVTRMAALQCQTALLSTLSPPFLNIGTIIHPLYNLTDASIPQPPGEAHAAFTTQARETLDMLQKKLGSEVYVKEMAKARKFANERRDERRRKRRIEAVSEPERAARERRRKSEGKKAKIREKGAEARGKRRGVQDAFETRFAPLHQTSNEHQVTTTTDSFSSHGTPTPDSDLEDILNAMADPFAIISKGALANIAQGGEAGEPVVQCVQIKPMAAGADGRERYRVVWNDTANFIQSMMTQQANWIITEGKLKKGSICRLKSFQANVVKERLILVILDMEVLEEYGEPEKLGQPVALEDGKGGQGAGGGEDVKPQPESIGAGNFYGQKPAQQQQAQPQQRSAALQSRANANGGSRGNIHPIEALSPYAHKWTIKARVSHKGDIKTWHNKNGEGKLFSVNFLDESGEIRATGFNDAVDQWYEMLQEGSVYYISSPCRVQLAKKQFSNVNNDYELTFEKDTQIEKAEDNEGVPQVRYNFTTLADLQTVEKDTTIDCIGILSEIGEVSEIVSKTTSKPYSKRELTLVDNTGFNVRLTIWGGSAQSFEASPESVIAFKGVKVSDFGGRSLSLLSSGSMTLDPDIDEAFKLKGWYDGAGRNEQFQSHANTMGAVGATSGGRRDEYKTVAQVSEENLGMGESTDWFSIKGTILYVKKDSIAYPACRTTEPQTCNKKVVEIDPGKWRCEKCDREWDKPEYRYVMSVNVGDHTGQLWLSCFDETGRIIMGVPANDIMALRDEGDERRQEQIFADANCKQLVFRCKAKMDTFQDQQRVRYQVQTANVLNYGMEARKLAEIIKTYNADSDSLFVR